MSITLNDIVDAFIDDGNVMVALKADGAGTSKIEIVDGRPVVHGIGYPVEVLDKTHNLYAEVVEKFKLVFE